MGAFEKGNLMKSSGMDSPILLQGIRWPCATWEATQVGRELEKLHHQGRVSLESPTG